MTYYTLTRVRLRINSAIQEMVNKRLAKLNKHYDCYCFESYSMDLPNMHKCPSCKVQSTVDKLADEIYDMSKRYLVEHLDKVEWSNREFE